MSIIIRRKIPVRESDIDALFAWFYKMADEGYELIKVGYFFASFEKTDRKNIQYCAKYNQFRGKSTAKLDEDWIKISRSVVTYYKRYSKDESRVDDEKNQTLVADYEAYLKAKRNNFLYMLAMVLLMVCASIIPIVNTSRSSRLVLTNFPLSQLGILLIFVMNVLIHGSDYRLVKRSKNTVEKAKTIHDLKRHKKMEWLSWIAFSIALFVVVVNIMILNHLNLDYNRDKDLYTGIRLEYLLTESLDEDHAANHMDYRYDESLLVPVQEEIHQVVVFKDQYYSSSEEALRGQLWASHYKAVNGSVAKYLFNALYKDEFKAEFTEVIETEEGRGYLMDMGVKDRLLLLHDNKVHDISFEDMIPKEKVIEWLVNNYQ